MNSRILFTLVYSAEKQGQGTPSPPVNIQSSIGQDTQNPLKMICSSLVSVRPKTISL